ncbi:hypothetical protein QU481_14380 [Crenobacter sp. SG2303]|uniref:Uncharacterized protein n=1 Tax=Crenobacter oryzisoli TaxID=3056844 RepID=A0ABT7XQT9_9NEIS|nr:hypothetical protein [Crenobacter sp. SG2303]MDN0076073.1 hypothetical protein [Crenobacter sp. SG2303]
MANEADVMARNILGSTPKLDSHSLTPSFTRPSTNQAPAALEARLRQKRSAAYVEAMRKLDAGGHIHHREALEQLLTTIQQELPEIAVEHLPAGIVARCYLGHPYEVHTLDYTGQILQHYKFSESLPSMLSRGRSLALHPGYAFIEVYPDKLIAVAENGETSLIKG